jgi:hypothetical protein
MLGVVDPLPRIDRDGLLESQVAQRWLGERDLYNNSIYIRADYIIRKLLLFRQFLFFCHFLRPGRRRRCRLEPF